MLNDSMPGINIIPFQTIIEYITHLGSYNSSILLKGILTLFMFVPFSIFVYYGSSEGIKSRKNLILIFLGISFLYSFLSRLLGLGVFDIDTLVLRFLIALLVFNILKVLFEKRDYKESRE